MSQFKYFDDDEIKGLSLDLVSMLDKARNICGFAFVITSGFRTPEENAKAGGTEGSSHMDGVAVDLQAPLGQQEREKMIWALGLVGFRRIGLYSRHIHCDLDGKKTQNVAWFGQSH
jgi:uncharacterized protein YcbK (DUF882 family)